MNNCLICNSEIKKDRKFCSRICYGIGQKQRITNHKFGKKYYSIICKNCNKTFRTIYKNRCFCSPSCSTIYHNRKKKGYKNIEIICDNCKLPFSIPPGEYNKHKKRKYNHFFCSRKCTGEFRRTRASPKTSKSLIKAYANGLIKRKKSSNGGYRNDIDRYVRSSWEANFARILNYLKIEWDYEPKTFIINSNGKQTTYTPDFYIPKLDIYVEIKGYWTKIAKEKFLRYKKTNNNIELIDLEKYKELYFIYGDKINWEGKTFY